MNFPDIIPVIQKGKLVPACCQTLCFLDFEKMFLSANQQIAICLTTRTSSSRKRPSEINHLLKKLKNEKHEVLHLKCTISFGLRTVPTN